MEQYSCSCNFRQGRVAQAKRHWWLSHAGQRFLSLVSCKKGYTTVRIFLLHRHFLRSGKFRPRIYGHLIVNLFGLVIALASCIALNLYVYDEFDFDAYHKNSERIYRIVRMAKSTEIGSSAAVTSPHEGPALVLDYPQMVQSVVRIRRLMKTVVRDSKNRYHGEEGFIFADNSIFNVFTFPLIEGDSGTALQSPNSIVVSESFAKKHLGEGSSIGKSIEIQTFGKHRYTLTGVFSDIPANSHFRFDAIGSFSSSENVFGDWGHGGFYTYVLLSQNNTMQDLKQALSAITQRYISRESFELSCQRLRDIHLRSKLFAELGENGDLQTVVSLLAVSVILLLVASANFANFLLFWTLTRAKEVGLRMVHGESRMEMVSSLFAEIVVLTLVASAFASLAAVLMMPVFSNLVDKEFAFNSTTIIVIVSSTVPALVIIAPFAGLYPGLFFSKFCPSDLIKGASKLPANSRWILRKALIVGQFTIAAILLVGLEAVIQQVNYLKSRNLGFSVHNIVVFPIPQEIANDVLPLKQSLAEQSAVEYVTAARGVPGTLISKEAIKLDQDPGKYLMIPLASVEVDFIKTLGIRLTRGSDFSSESSKNARTSFIVNEAAVSLFQWDDPIGQEIHWYSGGKRGQVIGVVENFSFTFPQEPIGPIVLAADGPYSHLLVKLREKNVQESLLSVRSIVSKFSPEHPMEFFFLSDQWDSLYKNEETLERICGLFAVLAVTIACLGLFSLASLAAEHRMKEFAVRIILGASIVKEAGRFSFEIITLVLLGNLIASPVALLLIQEWLQGYPYRIDIEPFLFVNVLLLTSAVGFLTTLLHSIKIAMLKPTIVLKRE